MLTQRAFMSKVSRCIPLLLIFIGVIGVTACTWTNLLDQSAPIERIEIPEAPPTFETPTPIPAKIVEPGPLTGEWIGGGPANDGTQIYYSLVLTQDGTEITGTALSGNEYGAISLKVRGTYEDKLLELEEYGEGIAEVSEDPCYWRLHLRLRTRGASGAIRLVGPFDSIPNSKDTCTIEDEIALTQQ